MLADPQTKVTLYTKVSCSFCVRAKWLLEKYKIPFTEIYLDDPVLANQFRTKFPNLKSVPQIFVDEVKLLGGCNELEAYIERIQKGEKDYLGIFPVDNSNQVV